MRRDDDDASTNALMDSDYLDSDSPTNGLESYEHHEQPMDKTSRLVDDFPLTVLMIRYDNIYPPDVIRS